MRLRQNKQPLAEQQYLDMAGFNAGAAFKHRIHRVIAFAEIAADKNFTTPETKQERGGRVEQAETGAKRIIEICHDGGPPVCFNDRGHFITTTVFIYSIV